VGKVFTWTAVMQLVEQGKLDLDADINTYLDFRIPETYPQPITLKHLMTHTSGFENRLLESLASDPNDVVSPREWLTSHMAARVRPPGEYAGYANFNAMLAGYIVARVSGEPYPQYIQDHILSPLGMAQSSIQWPMPQNLRAQAAVGYQYKDGVYQAHPTFYPQLAGLPSGMHHATVTDMARFMIAHLQDGRYSDAKTGEARIMNEATAQKMHATAFTPDPSLRGTAHGFFDFSDNGQRTLGHSGYMEFMNGLLLLLPDQNLGVYVVYNSLDVGALVLQHSGFQRAFFDHYYPASEVAPIQPPADFAARANRFVGNYRYTMRSYTTADKIGTLLASWTIKDSGDGALILNASWGGGRFVEVAPLHFRHADGQYGMVFREDGQGRITQMFTDFTPQMAYEKLDWYDTPGFHLGLLMGTSLLFLSMIPVALIVLVRGRQRSRQKTYSRGAGTALGTILGVSVLNLVVSVVSWLYQYPVMLFGHSAFYKAVLGLGVIAAVLTVGALVYAVLAWKDRYWGVATRAHYSLVTVAAVAYVWFLNYWNLLGWRW
jgi:CubicO group peptidase (beta-lactamase class C family)